MYVVGTIIIFWGLCGIPRSRLQELNDDDDIMLNGISTLWATILPPFQLCDDDDDESLSLHSPSSSNAATHPIQDSLMQDSWIVSGTQQLEISQYMPYMAADAMMMMIPTTPKS